MLAHLYQSFLAIQIFIFASTLFAEPDVPVQRAPAGGFARPGPTGVARPKRNPKPGRQFNNLDSISSSRFDLNQRCARLRELGNNAPSLAGLPF